MQIIGKSADDIKRLFFGASLSAPWPQHLPEGRLIPEDSRHITLSFLAHCNYSKLLKQMPQMPLPPLSIGQTGIADRLVFLPPHTPRVAAMEVRWMSGETEFLAYQEQLSAWLTIEGYQKEKYPFYPHISMARRPFDPGQWAEHISAFPFYVRSVALYESLGGLQYSTLWEQPYLPPFEEMEHTADIAFHIRARTPQELHMHAQLALAFHFPGFLPFFTDCLQNTLSEIVIALNESVSRADASIGCPFKAVSFHGNIHKDSQHILHWEMIVDV